MLTGIEPLSKPEGGRAEELVRRIEALIAERRSQGDAALGSKEALRQTFQVAHGTLNEALRVLEMRGLIELRRGPLGGVFATSPSIYLRLSNVFLGFRKNADSIQQCLAVRDQIEALTIVEATKVALQKPDEVKGMYEALDKMYETATNPTENLHWNWQFHRCIARMGANPILTGIYLALIEYIDETLTEVAPAGDPQRVQRVLQMHRDIADAIASGNELQAAEAASHHPLPPEGLERPAKKSVKSSKKA